MTGFDNSPRMIEICRGAVPGGDFRIHQLGEPIGWLGDAVGHWHGYPMPEFAAGEYLAPACRIADRIVRLQVTVIAGSRAESGMLPVAA